jgi:VanZ family protein
MKHFQRKLSPVVFFVYYYLPLLVWMGAIFYLSSRPGMVSREAKDFWFYAERKGAHVAEYFLLQLLFLRILLAGRNGSSANKKRILISLSAFLFSFIYALTDEFHQLFVFGREGKISDVGVDLVGILSAVLACWLVRNFRK